MPQTAKLLLIVRPQELICNWSHFQMMSCWWDKTEYETRMGGHYHDWKLSYNVPDVSNLGLMPSFSLFITFLLDLGGERQAVLLRVFHVGVVMHFWWCEYRRRRVRYSITDDKVESSVNCELVLSLAVTSNTSRHRKVGARSPVVGARW